MSPKARPASAHPARGPNGSEAERSERFGEAMRDSNPFASNRVSEPSPANVDVPSIHEGAYARLVQLIERAHRARRASGVAVYGMAGVGKSHLLARLFAWADEPHPERPRQSRACLVFLHNIMADPERLPRFLLKSVVSQLAQRNGRALRDCALVQVVREAIRSALMKNRPAGLPPRMTVAEALPLFLESYPPADDRRGVAQALGRLAAIAAVGERPSPADQEEVRRILDWLSGEEIDAEAARAIGIRVRSDEKETVSLRDDQDVELVLRVLTEMAHAASQPFVICIDQVDNLERDQLRALVRFLQVLIDHATNLVVVISGVQQTLLQLLKDGTIPQAIWDRITEQSVQLAMISPAEARRLLEARLERFLEPFRSIAPLREKAFQNPLFPLGEVWFDASYAALPEVRPRDVITKARDAWDEQADALASRGFDSWLKHWPDTRIGPPPPLPSPPLEQAIDEAVERKLEEAINNRLLHAGSLPPDPGNFAGLVQALLEHCRDDAARYSFRGLERPSRRGGRLPAYDLLIREQRKGDNEEVTTGVVFISNEGRAATEALKRLRQCDPAPDHRILITDEERRPLRTGATGMENLRELEKLGPEKFEHRKIGFSDYAMLDALHAVAQLAKVGDFEIEYPRGRSRRVTEAEVIASHHRADRFLKHRVLHPLLTEEPIGKDDIQAVVNIPVDLAQQYIMAQLSWRLGMNAKEITRGFLKQHPEPTVPEPTAWGQVKVVAQGLHADGKIYATPHEDDLFLQLRG
jgi:hypothetical protein